MRMIAKYKLFSKQILDTIPKRVTKFKRTKWKKQKKFIKTSISLSKKNIKLPLTQFYGVFVSSKILPRTKSYYSDCLSTSLVFKQFFDMHGKILAKKNLKEFDSFFNQVLIKQFFKPEILLAKLNFFSSVDEAVQAMSNGNVLINSIKKKPNYFLKKGDIITFNFKEKCSLNKEILNKKFFFKKSLFSFLEIDFFTKTIIVLKDVSDISNNDINLFIPIFLNIQHLKDFK